MNFVTLLFKKNDMHDLVMLLILDSAFSKIFHSFLCDMLICRDLHTEFIFASYVSPHSDWPKMAKGYIKHGWNL